VKTDSGGGERTTVKDNDLVARTKGKPRGNLKSGRENGDEVNCQSKGTQKAGEKDAIGATVRIGG